MGKLTLEKLNLLKTKIITLIQLNPAVTNKQISKIIGSDYRTVEKYRQEIDFKIKKAVEKIEKAEEAERQSIWKSITSLFGSK
jgi:hypothetical protein